MAAGTLCVFPEYACSSGGISSPPTSFVEVLPGGEGPHREGIARDAPPGVARRAWLGVRQDPKTIIIIVSKVLTSTGSPVSGLGLELTSPALYLVADRVPYELRGSYDGSRAHCKRTGDLTSPLGCTGLLYVVQDCSGSTLVQPSCRLLAVGECCHGGCMTTVVSVLSLAGGSSWRHVYVLVCCLLPEVVPVTLMRVSILAKVDVRSHNTTRTYRTTTCKARGLGSHSETPISLHWCRDQDTIVRNLVGFVVRGLLVHQPCSNAKVDYLLVWGR